MAVHLGPQRYKRSDFLHRDGVAKKNGNPQIATNIIKSNKDNETYRYYANIVRSADSAIISWDLSGKIITWNRSAEKLFGYKESEVIGKNFSIIVPDHKKRELAKIEALIRKGRLYEDFETERLRKNGEIISIIANGSPIRNEYGKIIGTSVFDRDNSAAKKEQRQQEYLNRATKILSSSLDYRWTLQKLAKILVPDLADWSSVQMLGEDGKLANLAVAHVDPGKVRWALDLQRKFAKDANQDTPENKKRLAQLKAGNSTFIPNFTKTLMNKMVKERKYRVILKKIGITSAITVPIISGKMVLGAMSLVSTRGNSIFDEQDLKFAQELGKLAGQHVENSRLYHVAQTEIKKRKKIQNELYASREELSVILANVADGITVFDEDSKVVFVNNTIAAASGYKSSGSMLKDPLKWRNTFKVFDENGKPLAVSELPGRQAVRTRAEVEKIVRTLNLKTGEERWAVVKARPIINEEGELEGAVSVTSDITAQKELERKKDDFISIASHELKTPITSIKGFIHLLKKDHEEYERSSKFLNRIDNQLNKLGDLIEDLLDISRVPSGKMSYKTEEFDMGELVEQVVDDMQEISDHKIVLHDGVHIHVGADRDRISQVLINLINNAIKYSPDSDKVVVELAELKKEIEVRVKDYGIGIDTDEKDKIFDRFYRVKDPSGKTFPGLGIGLYLSREIAERHNGKIWVESKKGHGSVFHFSLPKLYEKDISS